MVNSMSSARCGAISMIGTAMVQLMATAVAGPIALPGCPENCGEISVPYPFGIGQGCSYEGLSLTCDGTEHPPKLFTVDGMEVLDISVTDGTVRVQSEVFHSPVSPEFNGSWSVPAAMGPFKVSTTRNSFVALGCNLVAQFIPFSSLGRLAYGSICAAECPVTPVKLSCSGYGCCRSSILPVPDGGDLLSYGIQIKDLDGQNHRNRAAVFIVDQDWLSRNEGEILNNSSYPGSVAKSAPTLLEWSLKVNRDNDMFSLPTAVSESSIFRCPSINSFSYSVDGAYNYRRCNCSEGYEGNPYISDGCQDIDECQRPYLPISWNLHQFARNVRCSSKKSIRNLPAGLLTLIAISAGFVLLFSLLGVVKISNKLKKRRAKKLRHSFFKKNHGLLLEQFISSNKDIAERMKIFSLEELEQATNKFDHNRILGGGGHGTVYKGILSDQRVVAIKKSKIVVQREIDQFINEVVILSQTNHRNVVKLFGCCLETEVPLLVYEFISNGTLAYYLHGQSETPLSWQDRLRIALETAKAIAYLHSAASISVFHRDIKCANILLTETLTAKVSDFGASRSISIDETAILTAIQGTHGYVDPEYYYTSRLTDKSDVYSFGVILAELLTRMKPVFSSHLSGEGTSLASYFVSLIRDNRLSDILDPQIVEEGGVEDVDLVARLAEACLSLKGEERPTMRQVETTLEDVQNSKVHISSQTIRVTDNNIPTDQSYNGSKGSEGTRQYSLEKEFIESSEFPR